MNSRVTKRRPR